VGQEGIYEGITNAEKHVIRGAGHSTIFDSTEEHARVVADFFTRHSRATRGVSVGDEAASA
jgi:pimeloyl-ACP methyl ester carboxylesterase